MVGFVLICLKAQNSPRYFGSVFFTSLGFDLGNCLKVPKKYKKKTKNLEWVVSVALFILFTSLLVSDSLFVKVNRNIYKY